MKTLARAGAMLLVLVAAWPAHACIDPDSGPRIVREHLVLRPGDPARLLILDLLTIVLPNQGRPGWRLEAESSQTPLVRELTAEQWQSAMASPRFQTRTLERLSPAPQSRTMPVETLHFGAISTGKTSLRFVNDSVRPPAVVRIDVEVAPRQFEQAARGTVYKINREQAGGTIAMQYYDTLEITLPGKPEQKWNTDSAKLAGLELKDMKPAANDSLTFVLKPLAADSGIKTLRLTDPAGNSWSFLIEHRPTPVC